MARYDNLVTNCQARLPGTPPSHKPQRNKYGAVKVKLDGYTFDSKAEAKRYAELKLLQQSGDIYGLVVHPEFLVNEAKQDGLRVIRPIVYVADFAYWEEGRCHVEDVKGVETKEFKLKAKLFRDRFPNHELHIVK